MKEDFTIIERIRIPSDHSSLKDVEKLVDAVCAKLNVDEDNYGNVLIAVTEAVNNAIEHGNGSISDLLLRLLLVIPRTLFVLVLQTRASVLTT